MENNKTRTPSSVHLSASRTIFDINECEWSRHICHTMRVPFRIIVRLKAPESVYLTMVSVDKVMLH